MRVLRATGVLTVLALVSLGARQASPPVAVPPEQMNARAFLCAIYPELREKALWVEVLPAGPMRFEVSEAIESPLIRKPRATDRLLVADFEYDKSTALAAFRASGRILRSKDNGDLRERLRAAKDLNTSLADERHRFGIKTDATLSTEAPLEDIAQAIGTLSVRGVTLRNVARDTDSAYGALWEMSVVARKGAGSRAYALQFEPYGGRLVALERQ